MKSSPILICLFLGVLVFPAAGQNRSDPMPSNARKHQQSFFDWISKRGTSPQMNYGLRIEDARQSLLDALKTPAFWAQAIPWGWVLILFLKVCHEARVREQRLTIVAKLLAEIFNAHSKSRHQACLAIARHNEMVNSLNLAASARQIPASVLAVEKEMARPEFAARTVRNQAEQSSVAQSWARMPNEKRPAATAPITNSDYVQQINTLQSLLSTAQETSKNKEAEIANLRAQIQRLNKTNTKD